MGRPLCIAHLLDSGAPPGTWNLTNSGEVQSWADIARDVVELCGRSREDVRGVSTEEYATLQARSVIAPRPRHSGLRLDKIAAAGFQPPTASERLQDFVADLLRTRQ